MDGKGCGMDHIYEQSYEIGSGSIDLLGRCRPAALLNFLQEAATGHAIVLHVSRDEVVRRYHAFWMLARIWYRIDRPLCFGEELTVRTWHRGGTGAMMYRDFDLLVDGSPVGEAVSVWVLADLDTHRLCRLADVAEVAHTDGGARNKAVSLTKLHLPGELELAELRRMHYSDTDINGHINNIHYADFACDALHLERHGQGKFVREFQISYIGECKAGEKLAMETAVEGEHLYARGVGAEGDSRFEYAMTLADFT